MQGGFNIIPLTDVDTSKSKITIDFKSTGSTAGTDFRVTVVSVTSSGVSKYSATISSGKATKSIQGNESAFYLVVCATPDTFKQYYVDWNSQSTDRDTTYPYKVKITYS